MYSLSVVLRMCRYNNVIFICEVNMHEYSFFALRMYRDEINVLFIPKLRNRSAPAVNCWVIIHCLGVSCKENQSTSVQYERFIFAQLTDKQWIITQQFTYWSWSISILTHNKQRKHIRSLQLLPTFRHCTEELSPILRLCRIRLHVIVAFLKRKNDETPSNAMNDVIFQNDLSYHTL